MIKNSLSSLPTNSGWAKYYSAAKGASRKTAKSDGDGPSRVDTQARAKTRGAAYAPPGFINFCPRCGSLGGSWTDS